MCKCGPERAGFALSWARAREMGSEGKGNTQIERRTNDSKNGTNRGDFEEKIDQFVGEKLRPEQAVWSPV